MKADSRFLNLPLEFWANVKLISQKVGYTQRSTNQVKIPNFVQIKKAYKELNLDFDKIVDSTGTPTNLGHDLSNYFEFRAEFLNKDVKPSLMNAEEAKNIFLALKEKLNPTCPIPMNKQKGDKKAPAYFTGIINMIIESIIDELPCNFNPMELPSFTVNNSPVRSLSRRVDGCFPSVINPIAVWEIKEYYYTTTFGSRIADGVYESLLDGYELNETRAYLNKPVHHYLMIDSYDTWWTKGRSYLCRICDMLHMGLLDEALFGREVIERLPKIVSNWKEEIELHEKKIILNTNVSVKQTNILKLDL